MSYLSTEHASTVQRRSEVPFAWLFILFIKQSPLRLCSGQNTKHLCVRVRLFSTFFFKKAPEAPDQFV